MLSCLWKGCGARGWREREVEGRKEEGGRREKGERHESRRLDLDFELDWLEVEVEVGGRGGRSEKRREREE